MNQPLIGIVCGTRPEIIKLAPVYHALRAQQWCRVLWVHTGQHSDMAESMLRCFDIEPDVRLARSGAALEQFSIDCRSQLDALMASQRWDMCVVQGDTESAFLGALAAFYRRIPVAHVEAGLRTYNLARPFPEEGLRQMISRIASLHFAPTVRASDALLREGLRADDVIVTGNTVVDAQLWTSERYGIRREPGAARGPVLVTVHRREHWGSEMQEIFEAVAQVARQHPETIFRFPVHLNPVVQRAAHALLDGVANVELTAPFDYLEMQRALAGASLVLTDSGGLQEEAPTFGVPVLVLRHETERPECVDAGCALLVGPRREGIVRETSRLLADELAYRRMQAGTNPFGDGRASARIADTLAAQLLRLPAEQAAAA